MMPATDAAAVAAHECALRRALGIHRAGCAACAARRPGVTWYAIARAAFARALPDRPAARGQIYAMMRAEGMTAARALRWALTAGITVDGDTLLVTHGRT